MYLVGAGPGHPELLTLKAAELIKSGDVIVYDRLIQEEVLALAKPSAERIYMGKPVGKHDSRQAEVHELLVRKAREGKTVIRLKGGDPFLFGRGGEEAEFLAEHGIAFEVIPGVCSALSAPLSAGIAVTHRDVASAVAIVTGHNADTAQDRLDWAALAKIDTLVFLMAVHNVDKIAAKLIEHGRSPKTPACMIQMAFWHDERVVVATLETIGTQTRRTGIKPPATLVIGEVVRLHEKLRCSQRDLQRRPDAVARFQPAPLPDELFRMAAGGIGTQVLGWALENCVFDRLELPATAYELAHQLRLNAEAVSEILQALVALGLLESRPEGYRNLELASRYLRRDSTQSLRDLLLFHSAQSGGWDDLGRFARSGQATEAVRDGDLHSAGCESLARFVAPTVVDKFKDRPQRVLIIGWGGEAYSKALPNRWPDVQVTIINPFRGDALAAEGVDYDTVLLSGVFEYSTPAQIERILNFAAVRLCSGGSLVLHDSFLPAGVVPAPEAVLASLARQIGNHGYRTWSVDRVQSMLQRLGFTIFQSVPVMAGHAVLMATRTHSKAASIAAD